MLPEITIEIAKYLEHADLLAFIRVNKTTSRIKTPYNLKYLLTNETKMIRYHDLVLKHTITYNLRIQKEMACFFKNNAKELCMSFQFKDKIINYLVLRNDNGWIAFLFKYIRKEPLFKELILSVRKEFWM